MAKYDRLLKPRTRKLTNNAGFLRRAGALLIDILVIDIVLTGPFMPIFARIVQQESFLSPTYTQVELGAMLSLFLIAYTYFVLFEYLLGQTPGMMLLRTKVKKSPTVWQSFARNCFILPFIPFLLLWVIEPIVVLFTGQSLLERLTKTRIVYERRVIL